MRPQMESDIIQPGRVGYGDFADSVQTDTLEILSAARHYNHWIFSTFAPYLGPKVLEIGCGIGTYTQMMLDSPKVQHVSALEMMPEYLVRLQERVAVPSGKCLETKCQNILEDTTGLSGFDAFIMLNVLEHIEEDGRCLSVLKTLLNPQGKLLVLVPALPWLYSDYDRSISHHRRYTKAGLQQVVEGQGYRLLTLKYFNAVGILGWWVRFCMMKQTRFDPNSVGLFNALTPALRTVESICPPPWGLSLIAVAEAQP